MPERQLFGPGTSKPTREGLAEELRNLPIRSWEPANLNFPTGLRERETTPNQSLHAPTTGSPTRSRQQGKEMATEGEVRAAEIAAAEARTDTKITRMEGKLDLVISKLDDVREDGRATRANLWVVGLGLAVLIVAMITLFPVVLDLGMKTRESITKETQEQVHKAAPKQ